MALEQGARWAKSLSTFHDHIPSQRYPAERGRYVLYVNFCCPWSHRTIIVHGLKKLGDIVQLVEADAQNAQHGWHFSGTRGPERDPVNGVKYIRELYFRADRHYTGRVTLPIMWDKVNSTIVNNDSSDIIRMLFEGFDDFLAPEQREAHRGVAAFVPQHLRKEIDTFNTWVYENINNGVYKTGFANSQAAYENNVAQLFASLDRLEQHLAENGHHPYLFGRHITEADIRLYPTLIRFDVVYYTLFKCNLKMIRSDYPRLHAWLRRLYWSEGPETAGGVFKKTTLFDAIKRGYATVIPGNGLIPAGPCPPILPL